MNGYTASYKRDREHFMARCAANNLPERFARAIMRHATTATRIAVAQCNGPDWASNPYIPAAEFSKRMDRWQARMNKADQQCDKRIAALCGKFGVQFDMNGDPRGAVVKVKLADGKGNSWGGDGFWCVPAPEL